VETANARQWASQGRLNVGFFASREPLRFEDGEGEGLIGWLGYMAKPVALLVSSVAFLFDCPDVFAL
jgi:hypothetical protein